MIITSLLLFSTIAGSHHPTEDFLPLDMRQGKSLIVAKVSGGNSLRIEVRDLPNPGPDAIWMVSSLTDSKRALLTKLHKRNWTSGVFTLDLTRPNSSSPRLLGSLPTPFYRIGWLTGGNSLFALGTDDSASVYRVASGSITRVSSIKLPEGISPNGVQFRDLFFSSYGMKSFANHNWWHYRYGVIDFRDKKAIKAKKLGETVVAKSESAQVFWGSYADWHFGYAPLGINNIVRRNVIATSNGVAYAWSGTSLIKMHHIQGVVRLSGSTTSLDMPQDAELVGFGDNYLLAKSTTANMLTAYLISIKAPGNYSQSYAITSKAQVPIVGQ